jgi:hypothetical protein
VEDESAQGSVWFTLPGAGIGGSPDAGLYRMLLNGEHRGGWAWENLAAAEEADRLRGMTHDYVRHGTASLFAALDIGSGSVIA